MFYYIKFVKKVRGNRTKEVKSLKTWNKKILSYKNIIAWCCTGISHESITADSCLKF